MADKWRMFPATMGDDQAFISFNDSFAERAKRDARHHHLRVEVAIKDPTEAGMPRGDEINALSKLDDALEAAVARLGGIYVGRITVAGRRFFYFYVDAREADARSALVRAATPFGYAPQVKWADDPEKQRYWQDLYPTADDWRVINDMEVLDALANAGDDPDISRTVQHWAYFASDAAAAAFREWLGSQAFTFRSAEKDKQGRVRVTFTHEGVMHLADVTNRTIRCRRKAEELGGEYDGWETSVEEG